MKTIAVICGGKSPEHEISVRSAKNILAAIRRDRFNVLLIGIDRAGSWRLQDEADLSRFVTEKGPELAVVPGRTKGQIIRLDTNQPIWQPDVVFMIVHGPTGEDGVMQGLLRLIDLPIVGPDVLGSAAAMDKDTAKRLLRQAGVNVANDIVLKPGEHNDWTYEQVTQKLGSPVFIKPANMGSSVGVHKVSSADEYEAAVADAFLYDHKILIEEMIEGREVECAVLGNEHPEVTAPGEIITPEEYSFDAKYEDPETAKLIIPTQVTPDELTRLKASALQAYKALECEVLSRVDMFLTPSGDIYVNEINTLPGFTDISMYPKLWGAAGLSYSDLIERLLELAEKRHERNNALKTNFRS